MKLLPSIAAWRETQSASRKSELGLLSSSSGCASSLQQWHRLAGYAAGLLLRSLRDKAEQWWYFLDHPEVPQDFNLALRSLRLAVTKRKVSGGSRSMERFAKACRLAECGANLSPTGTVSHGVF